MADIEGLHHVTAIAGEPQANLNFYTGVLGLRLVKLTVSNANSLTLLLLHGTGGDERDLLPIGRELWSGAALLGIRGKVLENGMPRFLSIFAERVFDVEDLKSRTEELAHFIDAASELYEFRICTLRVQ